MTWSKSVKRGKGERKRGLCKDNKYLSLGICFGCCTSLPTKRLPASSRPWARKWMSTLRFTFLLVLANGTKQASKPPGMNVRRPNHETSNNNSVCVMPIPRSGTRKMSDSYVVCSAGLPQSFDKIAADYRRSDVVR